MSTKASYLCPPASAFRRDGGVVLILAVFAVALLTALAVGIAAAVRVELLASRSSVSRARSLYLAQAGLNEARAMLVYDDQSVDALTDSWGPDAQRPLEQPHMMGDGWYQVRVHDACGRIDINQADVITLTRLTGDEAVAAAIIDWRDEDDSTVTPDGAEAVYYESLPYPYRPRNKPFETPGELLLVRGVTPAMYFGGDSGPGLADLVTVDSQSPNTDASGKSKMSLSEFRNWGEEAFRNSVMERLGSVLTLYEAEQIFLGLSALESGGEQGYTSLAQLMTVAGLDPAKVAQLVDYFCVETDATVRGKVNLNTAPVEVIAALPGSSVGLAQALVARRDQQPFASLGEAVAFLMEQPGGPALFGQMIDRVTTKSSTFLVEAMGRTETGRGFRTLVALMRRMQDDVLVIRQSEEDWPLRPLPARQIRTARR
ncbi:MAG: general secretion pathway protein GspK [Armatimonadota bacterium]